MRESVVSGFPGASPGSYDYGMGAFAVSSGLVGTWVGSAGGELFPYINPTATVPVNLSAVAATPRIGPGVSVRPLLVDEADASRVLVSHLVYPDGRQVLLATMDQVEGALHSQLFGYEFIDFATSGLHFGARRVHLSAHVDDLFSETAQWDPVENRSDDDNDYRNQPDDITTAVAAQRALRANHPTISDFRVELAFNGVGALTGDPLRNEVVAQRDELRFLNHTYTHRNLDASNGVSKATIEQEINFNRIVWHTLGLPEEAKNYGVVVTGEHSGLTNNGGSVAYPAGVNPTMVAAFDDVGIGVVAGDSSRPGQALEQYVPASDILLLPRYPTSVFFDTTTPEVLIDEYNYIYRERHIEAGADPCALPGAICENRTYGEIIAADAGLAVAHMLSYRQWPHYFHTTNLVDYNSRGDSLLFDWLDATVSAYERYVTLPVTNLPFHEIAVQTAGRLAAADVDINGLLDINTGRVLVSGDRNVTVELTGVVGGAPYADKLIRAVDVTRTAQVFQVVDYTIPRGHPDAPPPPPVPSPSPAPAPRPSDRPPVLTLPPKPGREGELGSVVFCRGVPATVVGTAAANTLVGDSGIDVIHGLGGHDTIRGRGGNDVICGGPGDDTLSGGRGDDSIVGQAGHDTIKGNNGEDRLIGGKAADIINGGRHADTIEGGGGSDRLSGGKGADLVNGGAKSDRLHGSSGRDRLKGGGGADRLHGGSGRDVCNGGSGADIAIKCEVKRSVAPPR